MKVTPDAFFRYTGHIVSYARTVIIRAGVSLGVKPLKPIEEKLAAGEDVAWSSEEWHEATRRRKSNSNAPGNE